MAVTRTHVAASEEYFQQIERLVNSHSLHGSESLCKLLRYLAEQTIEHPGSGVKEYQIATEVFGRPGDFDPHLDSTVRVQAGRLRVKLAEYYSGEGAEDTVVVEVPKGAYALSFHYRTPQSRSHATPGPEPTRQQATGSRPARRWAIAVVALSALLVGAVVVIAVLLAMRAPSAAGQSEAVPAAYQVFWKSFLAASDEPWVIFSNGAFVGRPESGMRYFNPASDSRDLILDHYTGVGEVLAVHELDRVFAQLRHPIRV